MKLCHPEQSEGHVQPAPITIVGTAASAVQPSEARRRATTVLAQLPPPTPELAF